MKPTERKKKIKEIVDSQLSVAQRIKALENFVAQEKLADEQEKIIQEQAVKQQQQEKRDGKIMEATSKVELVSPIKIDGIEVIALKGDSPTDEHLTELIKPLIPEVRDGQDYILTAKDKKEIASKIKVPVVEKIVEKTEVVKEQPIVTNEVKEVAVTETAEQILGKLSGLPTDDDDFKLDASHIKNLPKEKGRGANFVVNRGETKIYDLSDQLNGVLKTFKLPAYNHIIGIQSSSFPNAFRPGVDYTFDPTSITFTSQIDASATLAAGQTLLIIYVT